MAGCGCAGSEGPSQLRGGSSAPLFEPPRIVIRTKSPLLSGSSSAPPLLPSLFLGFTLFLRLAVNSQPPTRSAVGLLESEFGMDTLPFTRSEGCRSH